MAVATIEMPKLCWDNADQVRAYHEWKDFLESYLFINKIEKKHQWHYIKLSAGTQVKDLWDSWQLTEEQKENPDDVFQKFSDHLVGTQNKWVMRLELSALAQSESESVEDFVCRLQAKAKSCAFTPEQRDEQVTFQLIKGIKWTDARRRLISKGNNLTAANAIKLAQEYQATLTDSSSFEKTKIGAVARHSRQRSKSRSNRHDPNCSYCGTKHPPRQCPAYGKDCGKCGRPNHSENVCQGGKYRGKSSSRKPQNRKTHFKQGNNNVASFDAEEELINCASAVTLPETVISALQDKSERQSIMVKLDMQPPKITRKATLRIKADTGANGNILPTRCLYQLYPDTSMHKSVLKPTQTRLTAVNDTEIHTHGSIKIPVKLDNSRWLNLTFYVCDTTGPAILSCDAAEKLGIIAVAKSPNISAIQQEENTAEVKPPIPDSTTLETLYPDRFKGLGSLHTPYRIELKSDTIPFISPPRKYPIKLREEITNKLQEMADLGVVKKCDDDEPSEWIHSLAFTRKASGELRVCLDPRQLNTAIKRTYHKIPTLDEISHKMSNANVFSKLDAKHGYWGIHLDEESSKLCTFQSPAGKYRFIRLPFGLSVSQDVFQARMDMILGKVGYGAIGIADDIIVHGRNIEEHDANLHKLMQVARQEGLVFRSEKCFVRQEKVEFFGLIWSKEGMQPDPKKCDDIHKRPAPTNLKELQSFLGLVQYLSPFIPNLADKTKLLRQLLKKDTLFEWSAEHEKAFKEIKDAIDTDTRLRYFDPNQPCEIEVDASMQGLGAALIQNGMPIAFASKSLTPAETRYANIEREMLSVVFALEHFHCFVYGQPVLVNSDHKPLESIALKQLNKAPPRLQRMLLRIQPYDATIKYKPGKDLIFADYLSRTYPTKGEAIQLEHTIHTIQISPNQLEKVRLATNSDSDLSLLREQIVAGWPDSPQKVPKCIRTYYNMKDFLSLEDGILFYGERMIVPQSLHQEYLERIHLGHLGITKGQNRAKESIFWKDMSKQIADYIGDCRECLINARSNAKEPMMPHQMATGPWQVVSSDMFEYDNNTYVLVADQFSKMPFVRNLGKNTRSKQVIDFLEALFSTHGTCSILVSDNGPQYSSAEFRRFTESWDIKHVTSSPHYPQSNGFIERMVGVVKNILRKATGSNTNIHKALLAYRSCPLSPDNKSPAELMFGRKIQSNLPVRSTASQDIQNHYERMLLQKGKSSENYNKNCGSELSDLLPGAKVLVQDGKTWYPATVKSRADEPRSYILRTPNEREIRRNRKLSSNASRNFEFSHKTDSDTTTASDEQQEKMGNNTEMSTAKSPQNAPKSVRFSDKNSVKIIPPRPRREVKKPKRFIEEFD